MEEQISNLPGMGSLEGLGFNFSPLALLGGFIFSVVGLYYFREGRKRSYAKTKWVGVALMAYPLVVSATFLIWCVGVFLWALAFYFKSEGQ